MPENTDLSDALQRQISLEQSALDVFYRRLDEVTDETADALERIRRAPTAGTPAALSERDAFAAMHTDHLAQLRAVGDRLCFGRLDMTDGEQRYVGRIGLSNSAGARMLIDWRAPAAEAFYRATQAEPHGVLSRRHLSTRGRRVTAVSDEVLDLAEFEHRNADTTALSEDTALLVALNAGRTGQMRDIVATIQAEQDRVIRDELAGVLVVQGGPGTGKTAVALHRAAFLLYAHRDRLARTGVLLIGPNTRFLRYIEQVLPSLGETGVVMRTPGELVPGVHARATDEPEVAVIKGHFRMARVIADAVRERQRVPSQPIPMDVDGVTVTLRPADVERARHRARTSRKPHNLARTTFVTELLELLVRQYADALGKSLDGEEGRQDVRPELLSALRDSRDVRREVNLCWMPVSAERLIADLFADPDRLARVAPQLNERDRGLLRRPRGSEWTIADVALLDEAAELLGDDDAGSDAAARAARAEQAREAEYAESVLAQTAGVADDDPDAMPAGEMMTAEQLAERYSSPRSMRSAAEHAENERSWAYGHVIVDEAQELSAMQWRAVMRRCPSRSMTLVGDTAQTGSPAGARSWAQVLRPYVRNRWRLRELTVNYRTPGRIMAVAAEVLASARIESTPVTSAREGDWPPVAQRIAAGDAAALRGAAQAELDRETGRNLAVIVSRAALAETARALADLTRAASDRLFVLTPELVKGLEFDSVIVVEPADIVGESRRGSNDLYVAMTRPTQRLLVLHARPLPRGLRSLARG